MVKNIIIFILLAVSVACSKLSAQEVKTVQNRPYCDLRTIHYGIHFGVNMQDLMLNNVGLQEDGNEIVADVDNWNPGFCVGVLAELRLNNHFSFRVQPAMYFGQKHLKFINLKEFDEHGRNLTMQQDLKTTYVALPLDIKFSSERYNNMRPYAFAGITPVMNINGKKQDILQLNSTDAFLNIGFGCDFYLPFFKLIPELRFCYGLTNCIDTGHADELKDENMRRYTRSIDSGRSKMVILTFYFE